MTRLEMEKAVEFIVHSDTQNISKTNFCLELFKSRLHLIYVDYFLRKMVEIFSSLSTETMKM